MKARILTAGILLLCLSAVAQHKTKPVIHRRPGVVEAPAAPMIFKYVEQQAAFNGDASEYIRKKLQYPSEARDYGVEGKTDVLFEITRDGTVRFLSIHRSSGSYALDAEARRVVSGMPRWLPAKKNGVPVRALMILPVMFRLD